MFIALVATWLVAIGLLSGCASDQGESDAASRLSCFVSVLPQAYFVERIGDGFVDVRVFVGPGQSPATYEPTPRQLARLGDSRLYFAIGMPFEDRILPRMRTGFPLLQIVETQTGVPYRLQQHRRTSVSDDTLHRGASSAGFASTHDHRGSVRDPHVWLDPRLAKTIADNIRAALIHVDPSHAMYYERNYRTLVADLEELDQEISGILSSVRGSEFLVFHPAFGYFADAYGLTQVSIETGGVSAGTGHLARTIDRAIAGGITAIFVQPQFSQTAAQTIADEMGIQLVMLDPLAPDYMDNLRRMAAKIQAAIEVQ